MTKIPNPNFLKFDHFSKHPKVKYSNFVTCFYESSDFNVVFGTRCAVSMVVELHQNIFFESEKFVQIITKILSDLSDLERIF